MKIALISHLYPTKLSPHYGKFIQDQFELLNNAPNIDADLIVPTPYSIPFTKRWGKNHSPLMCDSNKSTRLSYLSFPEKRYPKLIQRSLSGKLLDHLKGKDYDLIHIHWLFPDGLTLPTLRNLGIKTVITVHGGDWYLNIEDKVRSELIETSLQSTNRVLYSGPLLQNDIEQMYPDMREKSDVIYNMVDTDSYVPVLKKETLRKKIAWDTSKVHALTVANIRHEKGVDLLVDTISRNKKLANIRFHIIGSPEATEYSNKILKAISDNPFKNIELLPPVAPAELIKFYQAADFYILPSRREGFNVSILEAASCGVPLLSTDVGGNKKIIDMGLGLLNPDIESLSASSILEMADSYHKYDSEFLHQTIEKHFGKKAFLDRLARNYNTVLS